MSGTPILAIEPVGSTSSVSPSHGSVSAASGSYKSASFADILLDGIDGVSTKVANADQLVKAFILDDSVPVHQVTYALEQARLSLELMIQVRGRLVEGYQQLMNMQL